MAGTQNLIKPVLFETFHNVTQVKVFNDHYYHPFSLLSLLEMIQSTEIRKMQIMTPAMPALSKLSSSPKFASMQNQYKEKQYDITIDERHSCIKIWNNKFHKGLDNDKI